MKVTGLLIDKVEDGELPHRVTLESDNGLVYGAGATLSGALMSAFSVCGLFPNKDFPHRNNEELANFIFWSFNGGENWVKAISALRKGE
jgi:hypothetical protein